MAETREVYRIGENGRSSYAGYARFDNRGNFQGTRGGYGTRQAGYRGINSDRTGNNRANNRSMVQNAINTAGTRQTNRRRAAGFRA